MKTFIISLTNKTKANFKLVLLFCFIYTGSSQAITYYTRGAGGNWSSTATWSTASCNGTTASAIPGSGDDVIICASNGGGGVTVTVDGNYTCNTLTVGSGNANATVQITTAGKSLTVNSTTAFNTGVQGKTFLLDAGPGAITLTGAVSWGNAGTNTVQTSTGSVTFGSALNINNTTFGVSVTSTGSITFNNDFTDSQNKLSTAASSNVNFYGNYTISSAVTWNSTSNAKFYGTSKTTTPTANITFGNVIIQNSATHTIASAAGTVAIAGSLTLNASSSYTLNEAITVTGNVTLGSSSTLTLGANLTLRQSWTNNGGTLSGGTYSVIFRGSGFVIDGSSSTTFSNLQFAVSGSTCSYTLNTSITCGTLTFNASTKSITLTHGTSNPSLTVTGDVTMNQPTNKNTTCNWKINGGSASIAGNFSFVGTNTSTSRKCSVTVTTGTFALTGTLTWMNQTAVANETISVTTGTLTFSSSLSMPVGSGTLSVTGAATVNFNGSSAPSFALNSGGSGTNASFTTTTGCTLNFAKGFTNATVALTIASGSYSVFTGSGTITPTAAITFGNLTINSGVTATLAGNISVANNWLNSGGTLSGNYTVTFNGVSGSTQTITKSGGETFYGLTASVAGAYLQLVNDVTATNALTMSGHNIDMNSNTLTVGTTSAASTLTYSAGVAYNGTFRHGWQASVAVGTTNYGLFPVGIVGSYRPVTIAGTPTGAGYVSVTHTDAFTVTDLASPYYTDNNAAVIQRISDSKFTISTGTVSGGTYSLTATFGGFSSTGSSVLTDYKLVSYTGGVLGSSGTLIATGGTTTAPVVGKSSVTLANLANDYVAGTKSAVNTPIRSVYYSRKTGNWNDNSGTGTWSYTSAGAACSCTPSTTAIVFIQNGHTVTVNTASTVNYMYVQNGATLTGGSTLGINYNLDVAGTGKITPTAAWTVSGDAAFSGTGASTSSGTLAFTGDLNMGANTSLTLSGATNMSVGGDLTVNGTITMGTGVFTLGTTTGAIINGTGTIDGTGATVTIASSKTVSSLANLTIKPTMLINSTKSVTNNGIVTFTGNLTGAAGSSTWTNATGSTLNVAGTVLTGATGSLDASAANNTVNYNGGGAQTIKAPNSSYDMLTCSNAGTKSIGTNITVNSLVTIQDAAILDEGTSVLSGGADLVMTGTSELKMQRSTNTTSPELAGSYTFTGGTVTINQTNNTNTVEVGDYYNLKFTGASTGSYDISNIDWIQNDFTVQGTSTFSNNIDLTVTNNFTYSSSGSSTLAATLTAGTYTQSAGTLNDGGFTTTITGSGWTNNGGTFTTTGTVSFEGTAAQTIGGSNASTFKNLEINNTSTTGVTLNKSVTITNSLTLTDGYLYTSSSNLLTLNDNATATSGSATSFVDGPIKKIGNDAFVFPLGDDVSPAGYGTEDVWARIGITAPSVATDAFTAQYFRSNPDVSYEVDSVTSPLTRVTTNEYWDLARTTGTSTVTVSMYWEDATRDGITDCDSLTIAHWKGTKWAEEASSSVGSCTGTGSGVTTTTSTVSSYSPFTRGTRSKKKTVNPLPIELIYFDAALNTNNKVDLAWTTASEINNDYFSIERSTDGINFETVVTVKGVGNSNQLNNYTTIDNNPKSGVSYYRLKQTDMDGKYTYSSLKSVSLTINNLSINLAPNPVTQGDNWVVELNGLEDRTQVLIVVRDVLGNSFYTKNYVYEKGSNFIVINDNNIPKGIYIVEASSNNQLFSKKIIIQ